MDSSIESAPVI
jgi:hypothetical protein